DGGVILIAADGVGAHVVVGLADGHVARGGRDVDRAACDLDVDVAGRRLDAHGPDLAGGEVGTGALHVDSARDAVDLYVARGGGDVERAERAAGEDVGRLRADGEPGLVRAADPAR